MFSNFLLTGIFFVALVSAEDGGQDTKLFIVPSEPFKKSQAIDLSVPGEASVCQEFPGFPEAFNIMGTLVGDKPFGCGSDHCHELDLDLGTWTQTHDLPETIYGGAVAVPYADDQWWVTGGQTGDVFHPRAQSTWLFTPGQGFASHVPLPKDLVDHCIVRVNATHYFLAGGAELVNNVNKGSAHLFNSATEEFSEVPFMPLGKRSLAICGLVERESGEREVVVAGGNRQNPASEILDLDTLQWRRAVDFPVEAPMKMEQVPYGNTFLAVGGRTGGSIYKFVAGDSLTNNSWEELPQRVNTENEIAAFFISDKLVNC